jgi:hypothetical protein
LLPAGTWATTGTPALVGIKKSSPSTRPLPLFTATVTFVIGSDAFVIAVARSELLIPNVSGVPGPMGLPPIGVASTKFRNAVSAASMLAACALAGP